MENSKSELKQIKKREEILNGNLFKVILQVALPVLFYNLCNYFYGIFDMIVVGAAEIGEAADIVVLDQIKNMISTVGSALATGGGILVSRKYGEKNIISAKKAANALFTLALIVFAITFILIPIGVPFLRILGTAESTIDEAMGYYYVQILILAVTTLNNTMIALEKSKGNTLKLFIFNIFVIVIKISLSSIFAFVLVKYYDVNITWLGVATLIAQIFLLICLTIVTLNKNNVLRITPKDFNLNKADVFQIIKLALPVFAGRFLFSFGKVYVNKKALEVYGKTCVGALGISNTMAGLLTNMINSFEDTGSTIVSQNYGNENGKRIRKFFLINSLYVLSIATIGLTICYILKENIASFFAGNDLLYKEMIVNIFKWECLDLFFTGLSACACSIFYGLGLTRITMTTSMSNLFLFRIPTLLILMNVVKMNYEACGVAMFVSNTLTGIINIAIVLFLIIRLDKFKKYKNLFEDDNKDLKLAKSN